MNTIHTISIALFALTTLACSTEDLDAATAPAGAETSRAALTTDGTATDTGVPGQGRCYSEARHEKATQAINDVNYEAWKAALTEGDCTPRVVDLVTAENFARFAEAHRLADAGKTVEADAIRAEIGLPKLADRGQGKGMHQGQGKGSGQGKGTGMKNGKGKHGGAACANCDHKNQGG
jgi:hypothetical protein